MPPSEGIRKLGFRRWHERQLIESHVYLVTGLLSLIMVLACFEVFSFRAPGLKAILMLALIVGGLALCAFSLRLYLSILGRAEHLAEQSSCRRCGTYGRLRVTAVVDSDEAEEQGSLGVECRQCGNRWKMGLGGSA